MRVRYTLQAGRDLEEIFAYILRDNAEAAARTVDRIDDAVRFIGRFPLAGRRGRIEGTREMVVANLPYILVYRIRHSDVEIIAVVDGARRR